MAGESTTLGKLIVRLLLEKEDFEKNTKGAKDDIADLGHYFEGFADTINSLVIGALKGAAAAVAAFAAASTVMGAQFEQAITRVAATADDGAQNFAALSEQARKLGKETAFSATEAAVAMNELAQAGLKSADIISASQAAVLLAGATGSTMEQATGLLAATMSQFQLSAKDSTRVVDVFARAMNTTLFDMNSLTEAMKYAGTAGAGFGYSLEQTTAAVAMFRNLGLEGSLAGTAFKMALASASDVTEKGQRVLAKYGLTARDISPALHDFADIMETIGKAGITTSDALEIFGTRAGANVAAIADQFRKGTTTFYGTLAALEESAGSTQEMYDTMFNTVLGKAEQASGAVQELMLAVFATYGAPLKALLQELADTISYVADRFTETSGEVTSGFAGILGSMTAWLRANRAELAIWFKETVELVQGLMRVVMAVAPYLDEIAKIVAVIFIAQKVYAFVAGVQVAVSAVRALAVAFAEAAAAGTVATGGLLPLAAAITAAVLAIVGFIAAQDDAADAAERLAEAEGKVTAAVTLQRQTYEKEVAKILAVQQDRIRATIIERQATGDLTAAELSRLEGLLKLDAAQAAAKLSAGELVEVNGDLIDVETLVREHGNDGIEVINQRAQALKDAAAHEKEQYRRMAEAVGYYNDALTAGNEVDRAARMTLDSYGTTIEDVTAKMTAAQDAAKGYSDTAKKLTDQATVVQARMFQEEEAGIKRTAALKDKTVSESEQKALDKRQAAADKTAALERDLRGELAAAGHDRTEDVREELRKRIEEISKTIDAEIKLYAVGSSRVAELEAKRAELIIVASRTVAQKRAADTEESLKKEREAARTAGLDEAMLAADAADARLAEVQKMFDAEAALYETGSAEAQDVARRRAEAEALIRDAFLAQQRAREQEEVKARLEVITALELELTRSRLSKIGQIELDRQQQLRTMQGATEEERARVSAVYDAKVLAEKQAASARAQEILRGALKESERLEKERLATLKDLEGASATEIRKVTRKYDREIFAAKVKEARDAFAKILKAGKAAAQAVAGAFSAVGDAISSIAGAAVGVFQTLTGLSIDIMGTVEDLVSAQETAADEGTTFDPSTAAAEAVQALLDGASAMVEMLVTSLPSILATLVDGLPGVIEQVAAAVPTLVAILVAQLPGLVQAIADAIPTVIDAVVAAVPVIIDALKTLIPQVLDAAADALPVVLDAILALLPDIVDLLVSAVKQVLAQLPGMISDLLGALPSIIETILGALPALIQAILRAIPLIIGAIIDALPDIIVALVDGILGIVVQLAESLPLLIARIIELIPDLIAAILGMLPELITSVIAAVPDIILGLAEHLPELVSALIMLIPQVVVAVVRALPEIVTALVQGIFTELLPALPMIAVELVKGIIQGIADAFEQIAKLFGDLFREALGFVGDLFGGGGKGKDGDGLAKRVAEGVGNALKSLWDAATGWALSGIDYVPATMRVVVHPGEAIVPADRNPSGPGRSRGLSPSAPPGGPSRGGSSPMRADITVMLDSRVVDYATVTAMDRGHAPRLEQRLRKVSGVVKGYNRGKFASRS